MKKCLTCGNTYDDSWQQCMNCNKALVFVDRGVSNEEFSKFEKKINEQFQKFERRLEKVEQLSGAGTERSEKYEYIPVKEVVPETIPQAKEQPSQPVPLHKIEKDQDIESTIGLVWMNRIGVVALLFGVAFFLKYAFDNHWIGELGRVVLGLVAGLALIAGSEVARKKKYDTMSQGLHGSGVGTLYLSIYAAFGFYHLIPSMAAFGFLAVVTLYCGFWSIRTDWKSSAIIGIAGGFLTPFLIGINQIEAPLLLSYLALLDLGVLYISFYKGWRELSVASLLLTQMLFVYTPDRSKPEMWLVMLGFSTVYFAIFSILPITRNLVRRERSDGLDVLLVLLNGLVYFGHTFTLTGPHVRSIPGLVPLVFSFLYVAYSYSALKRSKEDAGLILSYVGLAILFVTIAIPVQLKQNWITISWAVEAVVISWIGFRINNSSARKISLAIGAMSLFRMFVIDFKYDPFSYSKYSLIWNERTLTYIALVGCLLFMGWMYKKYKSLVTTDEKPLSTVLVLIANVIFLAQLCLEAHSYFAHVAYVKAMAAAPAGGQQLMNAFWPFYQDLFSARELTISILLIVYALADIAMGIYAKFRAIRITALMILGAAVLKIFLFDLSQLDRIYRIISFMGLGAVLMITSFFYQKYKDQIREFALKD